MANAVALQEQLDLLRASYTARLPDRLRHIDETWDSLLKNAWDVEALCELHRAVHSLAGSGGTFGFPALGNAARTLEVFLKSIQQNAQIPTPSQRSQIGVLLAELKNVSTQAATGGIDAARLESMPPPNPTVRPVANRLIFLIESDPALVRDLTRQLGQFDYVVQPFTDPADLKKAVLQTPPAAIIADAVAGAKELVGAPVITALQQEFQQEHEVALPILFLADEDDLTTRLQAVRAGGIAYFTKPVEMNRLLDKLAIVTANQAPDPFRILIIDDEVAVSALYSFIICRAGMLTRIVNDSADTMQALIEFQPDAILMSMHLPSCSGLELAAVIRQQEAFMSLPIIFLSPDPNLNRSASAVRLGGDDFLAKPIQPLHLTAAVIAAGQLSRTLRSCMACDSLTGLSNHTNMTAQLDTEVVRARRQSTPLAFAHIDIDAFQSINDTHGHLVGDRVLKSLSHLLRQRLRRTDILGRYGSDEFGIILGGADSSQAVKILQEMCADFARIQHHAAGVDFCASFSCGVAVLPPSSDAVSLSNAAAQALAEAKADGHGCVAPANRP